MKSAEEMVAEHDAARLFWEEEHPLLTFRVTRSGGEVLDVRGHGHVTSYASHVRVFRSLFRWGLYQDVYGNDKPCRVVTYEAFDVMSIELLDAERADVQGRGSL